jgi:hypothetical protein
VVDIAALPAAVVSFVSEAVVEAAAVAGWFAVSFEAAVPDHIAGLSRAGKARGMQRIVLANLARHGVDTVKHAGLVAGVRSGRIAVGDRRHCWRGGAEVAPGDARVHRGTRRAPAAGAEALQGAMRGAAEARVRVTAVRRFAWRSPVPL